MSAKMNVPELRFGEFSGEWTKSTFKKLVRLQRGSSPRPIIKYVTKSDDGVNWIKIGDTKTEDIYINSTKEKITKLGALKSRKVHIGEIILSNSMSYGKPYILNIEGYIHDGWFVIREYQQNFNTSYLYQIMSSEWIQKQYKRLAAGGVVSNISSELVNAVKINLPPKPEQEKIASFLSSVDSKIEQLSKKKTLLEQYKKGVMQKIFSQELRFKDDDGSEFPEWVDKKLRDVAVKKSSNISANKIEDNFGEYIIYGASGILKLVDFYEEADDYVSIVKDGAGVGRILYCKGKSSVLGTMDIIKPKIEVDTYFLYCLLDNIDFTKYVSGSTIPHIYFKDYSNEKCGLPSLKEQTKIASFLSSLDKKIELANKELNATKEFKKALLQKMFV